MSTALPGRGRGDPRDISRCGSPLDGHEMRLLKFRMDLSGCAAATVHSQSGPYWVFLTLETGESELLLPWRCNTVSQVPEYHQMAIDFLAGCLSCRHENCSLAWLRVVKMWKLAKRRLKTLASLADPARSGYRRDLHFHGQRRASVSFLPNVDGALWGLCERRRHTGLAS